MGASRFTIGSDVEFATVGGKMIARNFRQFSGDTFAVGDL